MRTSISVEAPTKDQALSTVLGYVAPSMSTNVITYQLKLITMPLALEESMTSEELDLYLFNAFRRQYAIDTGNDPENVLAVPYRKRKLLMNDIVQYILGGEVWEADPNQPDPEEPTPEEPPVEEPPIPTE
ncbi:hypothetical protein O7630_06665 [Micromonospora sp. WMMD718]|uniref:hypothetical protein n=1 Tax=unclassified Micromonospora TaxID=2617518 RepID=UPI00128C6C8F|nr:MULTISPECIES: hypothetical protein [unclassified Micromonospora]MDG4750613.1 hypothetical protein [Micromonospora sp. WMMD718]